MTIVPSWACNLRCSFCYQPHFSPNIFLSDDVLYGKLDEAYKRCAALTLLGGEITFLKNMKPYVRYLDEKYPHIAIKIITNAVLLDDEWIDIALSNSSKLVFQLTLPPPQLMHIFWELPKHRAFFGKL